MKLNRLVLATGNPGKVVELRELLGEHVAEILSAKEVDGPDVVEDAPTLRGNAEKKARALFEHTGLPCLADDTGLEVTALNGAPGVHSARYAGPACRASDNIQKLLVELQDKTDRSARFRTVVAYVDASRTLYFDGVCEGEILSDLRGEGGFGYDPVFLPEGESLTFAELPHEQKNRISHRGRALQAFLKSLETW